MPEAPRPGQVARRGVDGELVEWLDVPERARTLSLQPHPEGGWYRRTWTAPDQLAVHGGSRPAATLILFLLPPGEASAWHVVTSDEIWLWHGPGSVRLELGGSQDAPCSGTVHVLDAANPQVLVPARIWQRTVPADTEALVSCVVSPGFSFADFTLA